MSRSGFVHLHLHSEYSLLDGGNRIGELVAKIDELGMDAVALTDHGNLFGAVDFYRACKDAGVKPILGIEAYVAPDAKTETSDRRHKEAQGVADGGFHLVLLAENELGWANLMRLSTDSYIEGFYYKPRMDKQTLADWNQGLIAINGHLGSSIAYYLDQFERTQSDEYYRRAREEAQWHREVFAHSDDGEPRFFLELQRHETPEQDAVNRHVVRLARELELPLVCDNDSHFLRAEDWDAHDTLICVSTNKHKTEEMRLHYSKELYVKAPDQMEALFVDLPEALENTRKIADRCNVELDFSANHAPLVGVRRREAQSEGELQSEGKTQPGAADAVKGSMAWFQHFCSTFELVPVDATVTDSEAMKERQQQCDQALRELTEAGLIWRYGEDGISDAHRARLEHELKVLADKNISAYFLIVWDFVNEARRRGIPAMARGSGVGTMVGYVLGLSNACPVHYGLLFERFTDPDRSEYPDIDIDLCQDGRGEILDYVRDKYGYVAQIITFGTMKARAAVRDVGRVHDLPLPEVDRICKLIGSQLGVTLDDALARESELEEMRAKNEHVREVLDTARALEGIVRHSGVHAAGVVIATQPLENLVPLALAKATDKSSKARNGAAKNGNSGGSSSDDRSVLVTQWDGPTVEKMGLLKMDFLGLKTLSVLERARQLVSETLDQPAIAAAVGTTPEGRHPLDLDRIDFTDTKVLDLYRRGETMGTFQFESDGMRNLLLKMQPDRLEDLVAANALFRPGPMALIDDYCDRKHGRQEVPQTHEIVDRFTADTHGIMVYQEQVMQIVHELGGIPLREAYSLIKAISKKNSKTINAARARFTEGSEAKGLTRRGADQLFELILRFAGYGFNKSHSVGYSILAFQTAYLKTYFPIQFMAAVLTYESDNTDKLSLYLDECKRVSLPNGERGLEVHPPDINRSGVRFHVVYSPDEAREPCGGHIRFGLSAVKGVGIKAVEAILEARSPTSSEASRELSSGNGEAKPLESANGQDTPFQSANGRPFESLYEFCERVPLSTVNRSTIEALIKAGAFDSMHGPQNRAAMVEALENAIRSGQRVASDRESGQSNLFGGGGSDDKDQAPTARLPEVVPWSNGEQLRNEKSALGFYATQHPLDEHQAMIERLSNSSVASIQELGADMEVWLGAMIANRRTTRTRKGRNPGQKMGLLTLEDKTGKIEAVVWADLFAELEEALVEDAILFFRAKVDRRREEPTLVVSQVISLDEAPKKLTQQVKIVLERGSSPRENAPGNSPDSNSPYSGKPDPQLTQQLQGLRELLHKERANVNGTAADVLLEIELSDRAILTNPGIRIPLHSGLEERVAEVLQIDHRCELLGPGPPKRVEPDPDRYRPGFK